MKEKHAADTVPIYAGNSYRSRLIKLLIKHVVGRATVKCDICYQNVCPSICLSALSVRHTESVQDIEIHFTRYNRGMFSL